uniref:Uncharacterized protein LOC111101346 n=1 Tax=Crassostrea virginica TaxID=6565 RepID=A0A8B8AHN1_CRAVI|nr:uncharacterized protein LOC111101346 [Crassostrea virginica]
MGWEFARVVCYTMCSFLPNTVLLGWSFFSPYWINDKSNNGTTECFRGVLFNVGCVDEDKRLGDAVLGLLIAYFACIVLGLMAYLRCYQYWCNEEEDTVKGYYGCCEGCFVIYGMYFYTFSGAFGLIACQIVNVVNSDHEKGLAFYLCFAAGFYPFIQTCFMSCVIPLVIENIQKEKKDCVIRARQEVTSYVIYGSNPSSEGVVMG